MKEREKTYEEEIVLTDILFYCAKKWRWIVGTMLVAAVLAGGYKYYSATKGNQLALQQWENRTPEEDAVYDTDVLQYLQSAMWESTESMQSQKDYLENSVVMQLDANHLQKGTLSYALKTEEADSDQSLKKTLAAAYRAYVTDGRLAQLLYAEDEGIAISDLQQLVKFVDAPIRSVEADELSVDIWQYEPEAGIFQIQIISDDADNCAKYLDTAEREIQAYSEELQDQIGRHELTLLGSNISESQDQDLRDYQTKVLDDYKTAARELNMMRTEEGERIKNAGTGAGTEMLSGPALTSPFRAGVKYGILGLVLGAFLAGVILIIRYLMSDRLRRTVNFESKFGVRLLGRVVAPAKGRKIFGFLDRWLLRLGEGAYASLPYEEQIKIVSANVKAVIPKNAGNTRIMIAGSIAAKDTADICGAFGKEIKDAAFSGYRQLVFDASALEELSSCDGVLFVEKKDVSSSKLIYQECRMAADRAVPILGAIIL